MPWCETCSKFWTPTSMHEDGSCPTCGLVLTKPDSPVSEPITAKNVDVRALAGKEARAPWHFKLLVVALAVYLTWRVVQLVLLIFH
jgi:hypothetical protein